MERFATELEARAERIAGLVSSQNGLPISMARQLEVGYPTAVLRYYAGLARTTAFSEVRAGLLGGSIEVRRVPVGVVAAIVPWNYPQVLSMFKIAPAMAVGCTVVLKPSPEAALDAFLIAEAAEAAAVPAGVLNIVPGGREAGAHLVSHSRVDKVAFTGSTAAGRAIAETCGRLLRPVTLELGGKSAGIVLDDAELDPARIGQDLVSATLANNGQTCFLSTRILAPRARYAEVVDLLTDLVRALPVGDALDESTLIGPMATRQQRDRVEGYIAKGRREGARVTTGWRPPGRPGQGLVRGAHGLRGRRQWFRRRAGRDLRPCALRASVRHGRRRGPDRQRLGLRPRRHRMDRGSECGADVARRVRTGTIGVNQYRPSRWPRSAVSRPVAWAPNSGPRGWRRTCVSNRSTSDPLPHGETNRRYAAGCSRDAGPPSATSGSRSRKTAP